MGSVGNTLSGPVLEVAVQVAPLDMSGHDLAAVFPHELGQPDATGAHRCPNVVVAGTVSSPSRDIVATTSFQGSTLSAMPIRTGFVA
jgi:hypothetical protein